MATIIKTGGFIATGFILLHIVNLIFQFVMKKDGRSVNLRYLKSVLNVFIITILVYSYFQQFDITKDISKVILQSGSLIIAIATFAAQQALGNVISGFSISMSKPFNIGQKIRVVQGGNIIAEGIITDITIRHTVIAQFDGQSCIVPNSVMDAAVVINTNYTENVGNFLEVEVSYESDIPKACQVMQAICIAEDLSLNTEKNAVLIKDFSSNGVILKTTVWTRTLDDNFKACSNIRKSILEEFKKNNITIPYHTVHLTNAAPGPADTEV